jgi:hypothetical protein
MAANQFGSSTFPFVLGAVNDGTFTRNVSQTFLTDGVLLASFFHPAADRIFFNGAYPGPLGGPTGEIGQLATHNYVFEDASNLLFPDANLPPLGYHQVVDVHQYIGFTDRKFHDASNEFFTATAANAVYIVVSADLSNTFTFNDHDDGSAAYRVYPVSNTFALNETVTEGAFDDLYQSVFTTGQSIDVTSALGGSVGDSGFLKQSVAFRITGVTCPEKEYTPFVGESDDNSYPEVSTTAPTLGSGVLTLTHPRVSPTLTLTLKNPDFGNTDVLRFTKVDRVTRGGDRKIFSDLGWGSTQSFELTVSNICDTTVTIDNILDFLNTSLGEEIGLLDWEGRNWKGIIIAPETEVTPTVTGHSLQLVFEGELV